MMVVSTANGMQHAETKPQDAGMMAGCFGTPPNCRMDFRYTPTFSMFLFGVSGDIGRRPRALAISCSRALEGVSSFLPTPLSLVL